METAGGIDVRLNKDAAAITKYYLVSLPKAIGSGAVILAAGAIMLAIDWRIGVITLCLSPPDPPCIRPLSCQMSFAGKPT